jgi:ABC-type amino acid transport substrate-binding protein
MVAPGGIPKLAVAARYLLACAVAVVLGCLLPIGEVYAGRDQGTVYVFPFTNMSPRTLQSLMSEAMPGVEVTVFGRVGDVRERLQSSAPDAAIAVGPVLEAFGQEVKLRGTMRGQATEPYVLLSAQAMNLESLASKTIGCVDLVARSDLPGFVGSVLHLPNSPKVQRVTKVEDLLQLLRFGRADAVLLPERLVAGLKAQTQMDVEVLRVPGAAAGRTGVAFPGSRSKVESYVRALPQGVMRELGLDGWQ